MSSCFTVSPFQIVTFVYEDTVVILLTPLWSKVLTFWLTSILGSLVDHIKFVLLICIKLVVVFLKQLWLHRTDGLRDAFVDSSSVVEASVEQRRRSFIVVTSVGVYFYDIAQHFLLSSLPRPFRGVSAAPSFAT